MAAPSVSGMQDNITALRMKMLNQKLANERDRLFRPNSEDGESLTGENVKLQRAVLRRQELLERLRREQIERDHLLRPRPLSAGRRRSPSPRPPPSRRSLPDLTRQQEDPVHILPEMPYRYVPDHHISPRAYYLPPVQPAPPPPAPPPPQPVVVQQPYLPPQVVSVPVPPPNQGGSSWGKGDFIEMMMMQNVQMHQMVMQQMMLSSLPGNKLPGPPNAPPAPPVAPPAPQPQPPPAPPVVHVTPVREREEKSGPAVHHHHYSLPPGMPGLRPHPLYRPPVHHYTLPPIDVRSRYFPDRHVSGDDPFYTNNFYEDRDRYYPYL